MENQYILEKWEWTENDFEKMGWHDCPIYAFSFEDNVYLDIDYIFKWNHNGDGNPFTFWIAPATLFFENPYYLKFNIELDFINGLEIAEVSKGKNSNGSTIWKIYTQEGKILIGAEKYKQIIRRQPSFQFGQSINSIERGGISFSITPEKDYQSPSEIIKQKEKELRLYSLVIEKRALILKKNSLGKNILDVKEYLQKKRQIEREIAQIEQILNETDFKNW